MIYKKFENTYVLRMEIGDDLVEKITEIAEKEKITLGTVQGIGACDKLRLGLYNVEEKVYYEKEVNGEFELLSLTGNITTMEGKPYIHLHAVISDETLQTYGGHVKSGRISATGEIFIRTIEGEVDRFYDGSIGLNLLDL